MDFYRGSSFDFSGQVTLLDQGVRLLNLTGWTATSQIKTDKDVLIANLSVVWLDAAQSLIRVFCPTSTSLWPTTASLSPGGFASMDIRFVSPSGQIVYSKPSIIPIERTVTT